MQFSRQIFSFPIDEKEIRSYLSDSKERTCIRIENKNGEPIGAIKCYEKVGFIQSKKLKVGDEKWESIEMKKNSI